MNPMTTPYTDPIGTRIARWREARGWSQQVLAGLIGRSQGFVSLVESGRRQVDRRSELLLFADALQVTVGELLGMPPDPLRDPVRAPASAAVAGIRSALVDLTRGVRRPAEVPLEQVRQQVTAMTEARMRADYAATALAMRQVLLAAGAHGSDGAPALVEALFTCRATLKGLGHVDLARQAAELAVTTAQNGAEGPWLGQATYSYVHALPTELAGMGVQILSDHADGLQRDPSREGLETYGMCHLMIALQAAISSDAATAAAHLDEAAAVAAHVGAPGPEAPLGFNGQWFCPVNVDLWRVAIAAELGDASAAVEVRDRLDLRGLDLPPNRLGYYWGDMGRALARSEQDDEAALLALVNAEAAAPQWFRMSPGSVDLTRVLVNRSQDRAVTGPARKLARGLNLIS